MTRGHSGGTIGEEAAMHPTNWTCCTDGQATPWWIWLILGVLGLGIIIRVAWVWRTGGFRQSAVHSELDAAGGPAYTDTWSHVMTVRQTGLIRPRDVPRAVSVDEAAAWAGSGDLRRTELIYAPIFWVVLPLAAIGFLIQQTITDPTGAGWNKTFGGESIEAWPTIFLWAVWIGSLVWLLIAIGVLVIRLSLWKDAGTENRWIAEHGVAHSIHRASLDLDDGEGSGWATYIALDHRLDDQQAARVHAAFEEWLSRAGLPPSGTGPISSETLFGHQARGGYFFLHLPVSQTAGATTEHQWMLISPPKDDGGDVLVTPVPAKKQFRRMREKARRRLASQRTES